MHDCRIRPRIDNIDRIEYFIEFKNYRGQIIVIVKSALVLTARGSQLSECGVRHAKCRGVRASAESLLSTVAAFSRVTCRVDVQMLRTPSVPYCGGILTQVAHDGVGGDQYPPGW